jgi:hypothetical protein
VGSDAASLGNAGNVVGAGVLSITTCGPICVGRAVGAALGRAVGAALGRKVGAVLGARVNKEASFIGAEEGNVGNAVGTGLSSTATSR